MAEGISKVLEERGKRYGTFLSGSLISNSLKRCVRDAPSYDTLAVDQAEAIDMILHKISRIMNGDPNYDDNWVDIAGYAQLVVDRLATCEK